MHVILILQTEGRLSVNEPSHPAAGLHVAADSSVVVCLGGPVLQVEGTFIQFPKMRCSLYSWYNSRLTAGKETTMPCLLPQTRPRIKPMKFKMITLKLGVGATVKPQETFAQTSLHPCVL